MSIPLPMEHHRPRRPGSHRPRGRPATLADYVARAECDRIANQITATFESYDLVGPQRRPPDRPRRHRGPARRPCSRRTLRRGQGGP